MWITGRASKGLPVAWAGSCPAHWHVLRRIDLRDLSMAVYVHCENRVKWRLEFGPVS